MWARHSVLTRALQFGRCRAVAWVARRVLSPAPTCRFPGACLAGRRIVVVARHPKTCKSVRTDRNEAQVALTVQKYGGFFRRRHRTMKRVAQRIVDTHNAGLPSVSSYRRWATTDDLLDSAAASRQPRPSTWTSSPIRRRTHLGGPPRDGRPTSSASKPAPTPAPRPAWTPSHFGAAQIVGMIFERVARAIQGRPGRHRRQPGHLQGRRRHHAGPRRLQHDRHRPRRRLPRRRCCPEIYGRRRLFSRSASSQRPACLTGKKPANGPLLRRIKDPPTCAPSIHARRYASPCTCAPAFSPKEHGT